MFTFTAELLTAAKRWKRPTYGLDDNSLNNCFPLEIKSRLKIFLKIFFFLISKTSYFSYFLRIKNDRCRKESYWSVVGKGSVAKDART